MKKSYTVVFALMVLLSMTMSAAALEFKQKTLNNGDAGFASWSDGSTSTSLSVFETQGETDIFVDICTADFTSCKFGFIFTQENVFDVDKKLTTATLFPVKIDLFDFNTGTVETVTIQAQWTGVGDLTKSSFTLKSKSGDFTAKFSDDTLMRDASATGSINGQELGTSQKAQLLKFKDVSIITIK